MSAFSALLLILLAQRALELALAERNRRWAVRQGGRESGQSHYPLIVGMHVLFYLSLVLERLSFSRDWSRLWPFWLAVLILAQALRFWAILSLGRLWNTRIIVIPGFVPSTKGPYRFVRHPNYVAVAAEILAIPMLAGAYLTAAGFSLANSLLLTVRIREEERALRSVAATDLSRLPRFFPRLARPNGRMVRSVHAKPGSVGHDPASRPTQGKGAKL